MGSSVKDVNRVNSLIGVSNADGSTPVTVYVDPTTHRMLVSTGSSGTVTSVSVVTANGVSGTVATATTTPAITLTLGVITPTSVNGLTITTTTGTFTLTNAKILTVSNTMTLAATDGKGINVGAATSGKILIGDGTNMVLSANTFPNASATSGKIIKSDGTNWVASTETYATPGTSGNILTSDGTNWTSAAAASGGKYTLLVAASGTTTSTTAELLSTVALTGLTALDTIETYVSIEAVTADVTTAMVKLYNSTDSVTIGIAWHGTVTAGTAVLEGANIRQAQSANTKILSAVFAQGGANTTISTFTTAWTGSWTLALRNVGLTAGGTLNWSWAAYKIAGQ